MKKYNSKKKKFLEDLREVCQLIHRMKMYLEICLEIPTKKKSSFKK